MRVAHFITGLQMGGAERALHRLIVGSSGRSAHLVISVAGDGPIGALVRSQGAQVITSLGGLRTVVAATSIMRGLRAFQPDVFQGWMYRGNLAASAFAAIHRRRCPVIWGIRSSLHDWGLMSSARRMFYRASGSASSLADGTIFNSRTSMIQHASIGWDVARATVIANGCSADEFAPDALAHAKLCRELGIQEDALLIGHVARWDPLKDHATFLQAAARLAPALPRAHWVLVGPSVTRENPSLARLVDWAALAGRVHFLGARTDIADLTAAFDVATSSSIAEAFSNALLEAQMSGVPCVTTDVGDSALIVGEFGRVVAPRDPVALGMAWADIATIPTDLRYQLGRRARERARALFSVDRMVVDFHTRWSAAMRSSEVGASA